MTTNKPEVFRFHCHGQSAPAYSCNKPADNSGEYVRLSDYERLQAECEKLPTCYQCGESANWLAPDARCIHCTRLTPEEIQGGE